MTSKPKSRQFNDQEFHGGDAPLYEGQGYSFKQAQHMATVVYQPAHLNPSAPAGMQGKGRLDGTWIYSEEPDKAEGILASGIELVMDSSLEANGSIGLHQHTHTEELYYLLSGELVITVVEGEEQQTQTLKVGDSHCIHPGQSHFVQAGSTGARFIVVAAKVNN
ncbi:cupin domain-containing protein [Agarivorans sp. B2Z047]|uniref:cupin domain-containing protein n=1 Tax=Agarivorans sp. B2Z047 TaxID=2652721 RepID=UPI00128D341B|nr:cupin domain-containing protein [Agarivorans sp. B2Z047]MPW30708.1 cupin domain-containing protein [Agarivorans sp. B2Z047]UQN42070.1 cupin domain-containing protein [Agarivorans sp. B2Z047]